MPIIETEIKPNETAAEAYTYLYTNLDNNKKYGGYHKGTTDDTYHHTSSSEAFAEDMLTDNFRFETLDYGTLLEMQAAENIMLKKAKLPNDDWYNKWAGHSPDDISDLPDSDAMAEFADTISETATYGDNEIQLVKFDKKNWEQDPLSKLIFLQTRADTLLTDNVKRIKDIVDNKIGDLNRTGITLMVVVLKDRLVKVDNELKKVDLVIGVNHTFEAIKSSKHCNHMPILYITEPEHKDYSDTSIDLASLYLNPREEQPKEESSLEDIAKTVHKIRVKNPGIQDNKHSEIRKIYKKNHLTGTQIKMVNFLVRGLLKADSATNTNWINWTIGKYKKIIDAEKASWDNQLSTICKINSSGRASVGDDIIDISAALENGEVIKKYVLILHHPSQKYLDIYDKKYRTKNKMALKHQEKKLGIEIVVIEKQTVASEIA